MIDRTGAALDHVGQYSIDPAFLPGNVENFFGVAQVPIGLAGPLLIDGEFWRMSQEGHLGVSVKEVS